MNFKQIHQFLNNLQGAELSQPFNKTTDVYKVMGKMYALLFIKDDTLGQSLCINLKCDPDEALALRATYNNVTSAYHMNKKHWNTVTVHQFGKQEIPDEHIISMMLESYRLVFKGLTKVKRTQCLLLK